MIQARIGRAFDVAAHYTPKPVRIWLTRADMVEMGQVVYRTSGGQARDVLRIEGLPVTLDFAGQGSRMILDNGSRIII